MQLLLLAFQLLSLVAATPNISASIRQQAITIANQAIVEAQAELAVSTPAPIIASTNAPQQNVVQPQPAPVQQSIIQPAIIQTKVMDQSKADIIIVESSDAKIDAVNGIPYGTYFFQVRILDSNGNPVKGVPVSMTIDGKTINRTIDTAPTIGSVDYYTTFQYIPTSTGDKDATFASGDLTKDLTFSVS